MVEEVPVSSVCPNICDLNSVFCPWLVGSEKTKSSMCAILLVASTLGSIISVKRVNLINPFAEMVAKGFVP
jgi:hypothetical protein